MHLFRYAHACTSANLPSKQGRVVIVAGGKYAYGQDQLMDEVNVYFEESNEWILGPALPARLAYGAMVTADKSKVFYIGGRLALATTTTAASDVYELIMFESDDPLDWRWEEREDMKLAGGNMYPMAITYHK